jgi:Concanavalin A-like lectin/glucanases superfamily
VSRSFDGTDDNLLFSTSAPVTGPPLTVACWVRPSSAANGTAVGLSRSDNGNGYWALGADGSLIPFFEQGANTGGSASTATAGVALPTTSWSHLAGVCAAANSRTCYRNGVAGTTLTTSLTTTCNQITIGDLRLQVTDLSFRNGLIGSVGVWNVALSAGEIVALSRGVNPRMIRPGSLVFFAPLRGDASPERDYTAGQRNLTVTGAVAGQQHPPVMPFVVGGGLLVPVSVVAGQTIAVGQAAETDLAQAIAEAKTRGLTQAPESDAAQAFAELKTRTVGQASSVEVAQMLTPSKLKAIGQALEGDVANNVRAVETVPFGQASELDAALVLVRAKVSAVAQAQEPSSAQAMAGGKARAVSQASEQDTAQSVGHGKTSAMGRADEGDLAQAIAASETRGVAQVAETDAAGVMGRSKLRAIGRASETDEAQAFSTSANRIVAITQATETDSARPLGRVKAKGVSQAGEVDIAQALQRVKYKSLATATEADSALALARVKGRTTGHAAELGAAFAFTHAKAKTLQQTLELDSAQIITSQGGARIIITIGPESGYAVVLAEALSASVSVNEATNGTLVLTE